MNAAPTPTGEVAQSKKVTPSALNAEGPDLCACKSGYLTLMVKATSILMNGHGWLGLQSGPLVKLSCIVPSPVAMKRQTQIWAVLTAYPAGGKRAKFP